MQKTGRFTKSAKNQTEVRKLLDRLIPGNGEFKIAFASAGRLTTARAKYVLAMLEKAADVRAGRLERPLDWASNAVTIEHILAQSAATSNEGLAVTVNEIGNLALLEKRLNLQLGSTPFAKKRSVYKSSEFSLTRTVADNTKRNAEQVGARTLELAELACVAGPAN